LEFFFSNQHEYERLIRDKTIKFKVDQCLSISDEFIAKIDDDLTPSLDINAGRLLKQAENLLFDSIKFDAVKLEAMEMPDPNVGSSKLEDNFNIVIDSNNSNNNNQKLNSQAHANVAQTIKSQTFLGTWQQGSGAHGNPAPSQQMVTMQTPNSYNPGETIQSMENYMKAQHGQQSVKIFVTKKLACEPKSRSK
jgi:hypothetical protein